MSRKNLLFHIDMTFHMLYLTLHIWFWERYGIIGSYFMCIGDYLKQIFMTNDISMEICLHEVTEFSIFVTKSAIILAFNEMEQSPVIIIITGFSYSLI